MYIQTNYVCISRTVLEQILRLYFKIVIFEIKKMILEETITVYPDTTVYSKKMKKRVKKYSSIDINVKTHTIYNCAKLI